MRETGLSGWMRLQAFAAALAIGFAGWSAVSPGAALAHSEEDMAKMVGDHGGSVRAAGNYHVELVVKDGQVRVWLTDHGNVAQATDKASGAATVTIGEKRISVPLKPAAKNEMSGSNPDIKHGAMRVLVNVTLPGEDPLQARFALKSH
ncbi:MAG: hypothetical protein BGO65_16705 [Afipia sp. 64-13]|nr:MAG: hypothetical protein BGO65_16705 [Afipia sp. 64-13]